MNRIRLQPLVRARLDSLGSGGRDWLASLPRLLAELEERWSLRIGAALPGGSASYVVRAETAAGEPRVVKVVVPDPELSDDDARMLAAARGHGYAILLAHDPDRRALLMEALGPSLERTPLPAEAKLVILADTLREAWTLDRDVAEPVAQGEDKASSLHRLVRSLDERLGHPVARAAINQALMYAERRAAFNPAEYVVVHGDPHPGNILRVPRPRPSSDSGWCLIDPDGFLADPAYDLGVAVRDWTHRLTGPNARAVLQRYCTLLADRTGVDEQRIWEWGYLERVSTGLYVTAFGADQVGRRFLESAERLVD